MDDPVSPTSPAPHDEQRAGDADRQRVADQLLGALEEGRLTLTEYDERLVAAYGAKTYGDLAVITRDLPPPPAGPSPPPVDDTDPPPRDRPAAAPPPDRPAELLPSSRPDDIRPIEPDTDLRPFDRPADAFSYGPPASTWSYGPPTDTWPVDPPARPSTPPAPVRPTPQPPSPHPTRDYLVRKGRSWLSGAVVTNGVWAVTSGFEFHQFYWPGGILLVWGTLILGKVIRGKQFNPDTDERNQVRMEQLGHELGVRDQQQADSTRPGSATPPRSGHPPH